MMRQGWLLAAISGVFLVGCGAEESGSSKLAKNKEVASSRVSQSLTSNLETETRGAAPDAGCALLDNPELRPRMSAALENKLLVLCGRAQKSAQVTTVPGGLPTRARRAAAALSADIPVSDPALDTGGSTQSETSVVAVGNIVCAAWNDAGEGAGLNGFAGFGFSLDGGLTFKDGGPFPIGPGGDQSFGDPSLAYSARDKAFYFASLSSQGLSLWRSLNGCQSFEYVGAIQSGFGHDKELIAVDNDPGSPYFGRIHMGWTAFGQSNDLNVTSYSDDAGKTWAPVAHLPNSGGAGQGVYPAVAPNGDVYMALVNRAFNIGGVQDQWIYGSKDGGQTWSKLADIGTAQLQPEDANATQDCGRQALNGHIRNLSSPQIVATPDSSASAGYVIHAIYPYDSDGAGPDHSNVFYRRSSDGASTWSAEVQLNDDGTNTDQFYPALGVDESGVLAASWYDRRLDPLGNTSFDRYLTVSADGGLSWSTNERVSDVSSPVAQTLPNFDGLASCYHGDYDQIAVSGGVAHLIWSDDRRVTELGPNPDVYYDQFAINVHLGKIRAQQSGVSCSSRLSFSLTDQDLAGSGAHEITVTTTGGDSETLVLTEEGSRPGAFSGAIATTSGPLQLGNGSLQVEDGATITATYLDADDGKGNPAVSTAEVRVDCAPPVLQNARVVALTGTGATITVDSSESAALTIQYGFACADLTQSATSSVAAIPTVALDGLYSGMTYFYALTATDAFGNSVTDDNDGSCYSFKTLDVLYSVNFEAGLAGFEIDNGSTNTGGSGGTGGFGGKPSFSGSLGAGGIPSVSGAPGQGGSSGSGKGGAPGTGGTSSWEEGGVGGAVEEGGSVGTGGSSGSSGSTSRNGLWHLSQGCAAALVGHSRPFALYYGQDSTCTFDTGTINEGFATSPPILLSDASFATVEFNYFLGTEGGGFYDQASLEVSVNQGPFQVVASNFTSLLSAVKAIRKRADARPAGRYSLVSNRGEWEHATADLTPFLQGLTQAEIRLRFHFNSVDSFANAFAGFYVDDIKVLGVQAPIPCRQNADCDDGLFCTGNETCSAGFCAKGLPVVCTGPEDGVACTQLTCDETARGCIEKPIDELCDDGTFCNGPERCDVTLGCQPGAPVVCGASKVDCVISQCEERVKNCVQFPDHARCDDGSFCTGQEFCDISTGCVAGSPPCQDPVSCTDDLCDEATFSCNFVPNDTYCNDGLFCNGAEYCDGYQGCRTTGSPCSASDKCDEKGDQCVPICFTDVNSNHQTAGRAYAKKKAFYALGSGDALGTASEVTSLQGSGTFWKHVPSCPAPPSIDSVQVSVSGSVARVSGVASDPNGDIVKVRLTFWLHGSLQIVLDAKGTTNWSGDLGLPEGTHAVSAQAVDRAGFVSAWSDLYFFTVLPALPPVLKSVAVSVKGSNAIVSGSAGDPNNDIQYVEVTILQNNEIVAFRKAQGTSDFSAIILGLAAGKYSARAQAFDSTGFASALTDPVTFDIAAEQCVTDSNGGHKSFGRAKSAQGNYYAVGSGDALGHKASTITALSGSAEFWTRVARCP
ncbi:MAG TPA: hypothetical protein VFQ61_31630 [Polyangiaceae bacterium]|nr:hypothetical protein [Polyangiaceae bacterium]